jgi:secreted trypsin-like serine protease
MTGCSNTVRFGQSCRSITIWWSPDLDLDQLKKLINRSHRSVNEKVIDWWSTSIKSIVWIFKIFFHAGNYANNIAILTLDMPVIFSKAVGPVCLPLASTDPDQYADVDAVTLGWGTTAGGVQEWSSVNALQQATVDMIFNSLCREEDYFGKYISELNICVKSKEEQPCVSDVGSPLVVQSSPGTWTVIGIHGYGQGCGVGGLKTSVSAFRICDQYL